MYSTTVDGSEIRHHLGYIKPLRKMEYSPYQQVSRISAINSITIDFSRNVLASSANVTPGCDRNEWMTLLGDHGVINLNTQ